MSKHSTLVRPPPPDPSLAPIENILSLTALSDVGPDIYTNARPLWHPPGARGIFGGAAIAQCLAAAQATIPAADFTVHSMHCYFVLAGSSEIPVIYAVERVRDGKSFATRTVQARQRGKAIFTTTMSFVRAGSGGSMKAEHQLEMPVGVEEAPPVGGQGNRRDARKGGIMAGDDDTPFENVRCRVVRTGKPQDKRLRHWIRARGRISDGPSGSSSAEEPNSGQLEGQVSSSSSSSDNHQAHLTALAYMSDNYFIGSVARVHNLVRFNDQKHRPIERTLRSFIGSDAERHAMREYLERIAREEADENRVNQASNHNWQGINGGGRAAAATITTTTTTANDNDSVGMMVSLDHTIYFHNPRSFRADEWMLAEMNSPWAGEGRGLVLQHIWSKPGILIATCVQEGVVRLNQQQPKQGKDTSKL